MSLKLMGKKRGMTQLFDENGRSVVCTVIEVEPNVVTQIKTTENDGYTAIQSGFDKITAKQEDTLKRRVSQPLYGHFQKHEIAPRRYLAETRVASTEDYTVGQEYGVSIFNGIKYVDATANSIGKGYQGTMKLYNFRGQPASHGAKKNHRSLGSTGNRSTPGRNFPGGKRACHMGDRKVTTQGLEIVRIIEDKNLILLKGAVPGAKNGLVTLAKAIKKTGA